MKATHRPYIIAALTLTTIITLLSSAAAVTAYAYQHRVPPRTIVAGLPIGNLTYQQATELVLQKEAELAAASLIVTHAEQTQEVPLADLGVKLAGPSEEITPHTDNIWSWATPKYWQHFFSHKLVGLSYVIDHATAQKKIEEIFNVRTTAQDAMLAVENNVLVVKPAFSGESLGLASVLGAIESLLTTGSSSTVAVQVEPVEPTVGTELAVQAKTDIEAALRPIHLVADNRTYVISKPDLYELIRYEPRDGILSWQIDDEKLSGYLTTRIAGRINVKMVQKLIQSDTQEVTQQGRDGKVIDSETLVSSVKRTIAEQIDTQQQPLVIPVKTVAFTEKVVPPEYVAGLFEGLYVDINLSKQKLFIMNGQTKTAQFLISSGKRGTATPVGLFYIKNKIDLAQSRLYPGIWMRNWNALAKNPDGSGYEGYGIHDLPAFNAAYTIVEGASHLGRPVSHGCVRLGHNESVWFYQNVPIGTPVNIHY